MNYDNPELRDRLAAEYVVGTLRGRARDRFERLLLENRGLRGDVERWERHLNAMALALPPRRPRPVVWRRLRRKLRAQTRPARAWAWPFATAMATATALILAVYVVLAPAPSPRFEPDYVAAIGAPAEPGPRWSISADVERRQLAVRALRPAEPDEQTDLELWLLPGEDMAPISLGLLPDSGSRVYPIPKRALGVTRDAVGLAISQEPAGGSPTGLPTGPVLYQSELMAL